MKRSVVVSASLFALLSASLLTSCGGEKKAADKGCAECGRAEREKGEIAVKAEPKRRKKVDEACLKRKDEKCECVRL